MRKRKQKFWKWFAKSPIACALRVAFSYIIGAVIGAGFDFSDPEKIKAMLLGAVVVSSPIILRWINPYDTAFGKGAIN